MKGDVKRVKHDPANVLLLFDMDGTLTPPRCVISPEFEKFLYEKVKPHAKVAIVGGSNLEKLFEQLGGRDILRKFDFIFPENGLVVIEDGKEVSKRSIQEHLGEETLQRFINFCLRYMSEVQLPVKRGNFIEFRTGMINVSLIGRQCSQAERNAFVEYEKEHPVREQMIEALRKEFHDVDLTYSIGGQISIDVFPYGWDKTYCLRHVTSERFHFKEIHFFGDKTDSGGNDYEIYEDPRTIGHKVESPDDTRRFLEEMFALNGA